MIVAIGFNISRLFEKFFVYQGNSYFLFCFAKRRDQCHKVHKDFQDIRVHRDCASQSRLQWSRQQQQQPNNNKYNDQARRNNDNNDSLNDQTRFEDFIPIYPRFKRQHQQLRQHQTSDNQELPNATFSHL